MIYRNLTDDFPKILKRLQNIEKPIFSGYSAESRDILPISGLMILGGGPGAGKTSMATKLAINTAIQEHPTMIFSFEMPKSLILAKIIQIMAHEEMKNFLYDSEYLEQLYEKHVANISGNLSLNDITDFTTENTINPLNFSELSKSLKTTKEKKGKTPFLVIDSLQTLPLPERLQNATIKEKIDYSLINLRSMTDESGSAILAIGQGNRKQNTEKDTNPLHGFSGSGLTEYITDTAYYLRKSPEDAENIEFQPLKSRYSEKISNKTLSFSGEYTDFIDFDLISEPPF